MAILSDMGVDGGGILQPKLKNRWRLDFVFPSVANNGEIFSRDLRIQAIQCDRPKREWEEIPLDRYNSKAYIAGKHIWQPLNITFEDDVGGQVATAIQQQEERQQKITGAAPASTLPAPVSGALYKFGLHISMLDGGDPSDGGRVLERWALAGCWLQNVDRQDLDYSVSETVKITTVVRFDHAQQLTINDLDSFERQALGGGETVFSSPA